MLSVAPAPVPHESAHREIIPALDGLRGVAILAVVLHHSALYFNPPGAVGNAVTALAAGGWGGVDVFFVLSGFLITSILVAERGQPLRNFYARRVLRIFPLYYLFLIALFLVLPTEMLGNPRPEHPALFGLYLQNLGPDFGRADFPPLVWGITWSLAIEEQFYLVWPWVLSRLELRRAGQLTLAVAVLSLALRLTGAIAGLGAPRLSTFTPFRLEGLALGASLALWRPQLQAWRGARRLAIGAGLAAALGMAALLFSSSGWDPRQPAVILFGPTLVPVGGAALLWLALHDGGPAWVLSRAWLRALGRHSYAMYLLHTPVSWALLRIEAFHLRDGDGSLSRLLAFWIAEVVACFLASLVTWHAYEKWFLRQKRHFGGLPR